MRRRLSLGAAAALAASLVLAACASAPAPAAAAPSEQAAPATPAAPTDSRDVAWDPEVKADFEKNVPKFVRALAKSKMEDMAREKGTYLVDRALYDEAMATYKR